MIGIKQTLKNIILFVSGAVIFSCISVYATLVIASSDVTYKKNDGTPTTVEGALNELYGARYPASFTQFHNSYQGIRTVGERTSLILQKGRYIVSAVQSFLTFSDTNPGDSKKTELTNEFVPMVTTTKGNCKVINRTYVLANPTEKLNSSIYVKNWNYFSFYDCDIPEQATITATENSNGMTTVNYSALTIFLEAIKVE